MLDSELFTRLFVPERHKELRWQMRDHMGGVLITP